MCLLQAARVWLSVCLLPAQVSKCPVPTGPPTAVDDSYLRLQFPSDGHYKAQTIIIKIMQNMNTNYLVYIFIVSCGGTDGGGGSGGGGGGGALNFNFL